MNETQTLLEQMVERFFAGEIDAATRASSEAGHFPQELWRGVEAQGLARPLVPSELGGLGANWQDVLVVLRAAGRHAVPLPLSETIVASWLLASAGLEAPEGPLTLVDTDDCAADDKCLSLEPRGEGWRLSGRARRVPWGGAAAAAVLVLPHRHEPRVVLAPRAGVEVTSGRNLAGEWRDDLVFRDHPVTSALLRAADLASPVRVLGAMARCAQITGALDRVLESTVTYANERQQFGRPIGKFQAVQHNLAILAGEVAACGVSTEAAFRAADAAGDFAFLVAVAKTRAGSAAAQGIAIGHQVHGAIGFTLEHPLQLSTRRLMSWRTEFGAERHWAMRLGRQVLDLGAERFWPQIAAH
jgi:acyl-CoA dehydrogenase